MSSPIHSEEATTPPAATASNEASSATSTGASGSATSFKSLADLQEKAPEVYNGMLVSIGMGMCRDQNEANARIKKANKEYNG
jgi:hypothetical protein